MTETAIKDDRERERVRWRCRRGLLELDLLLQRFLERHYAALTEREHAALARLLELPDPELLDYCSGASQPDDPELQALVGKIVP
jgi:succinate dehydrogenase flavin-adding protein (antitoxin of CptAB toxin-antitoxin module)